MPFKTKLTELCKIEHPIIQGGMHYVGCKPRLTQNPALPGSQSSIALDSSVATRFACFIAPLTDAFSHVHLHMCDPPYLTSSVPAHQSLHFTNLSTPLPTLSLHHHPSVCVARIVSVVPPHPYLGSSL